MTVPEKDKDRPVKKMWWDVADLHVVFSDTGEEVVYKNAHITESSRAVWGSSTIEIVPMRFIGDCK